ncbi:MAG: CidA/LrgA family protein [Bacillaceae bacterium]
MKKAAIFILQLAFLLLCNEIGYAIVEFFHLPIPGNVVGMVLLFILLLTGIVKLEWVSMTGGFLTKHLAFFFIPIAVGIMAYKDVLLSQGVAFTLALMASLTVGILVTGHVTQYFTTKKEADSNERSIA